MLLHHARLICHMPRRWAHDALLPAHARYYTAMPRDAFAMLDLRLIRAIVTRERDVLAQLYVSRRLFMLPRVDFLLSADICAQSARVYVARRCWCWVMLLYAMLYGALAHLFWTFRYSLIAWLMPICRFVLPAVYFAAPCLCYHISWYLIIMPAFRLFDAITLDILPPLACHFCCQRPPCSCWYCLLDFRLFRLFMILPSTFFAASFHVCCLR